MSVLIFVDQADGHIKKNSFEVLSYGSKIAQQLNTTADALFLGTVNADAASLGKYGVQKVYQANNELFNHVDAQIYADAIAEAVKTSGADIIIFSHNQTGRAVAPVLSAKL